MLSTLILDDEPCVRMQRENKPCFFAMKPVILKGRIIATPPDPACVVTSRERLLLSHFLVPQYYNNKEFHGGWISLIA